MSANMNQQYGQPNQQMGVGGVGGGQPMDNNNMNAYQDGNIDPSLLQDEPRTPMEKVTATMHTALDWVKENSLKVAETAKSAVGKVVSKD